MLVREDLIELSHITNENVNKIGATFAQCQYLNDLLYRCPMKTHNYILDKLYSLSGGNGVKYHLTSIEMTKLITAIENNKEFQFIEWNTEQWHKYKLEEKQKGLISKPYVNYSEELKEFDNF